MTTPGKYATQEDSLPGYQPIKKRMDNIPDGLNRSRQQQHVSVDECLFSYI